MEQSKEVKSERSRNKHKEELKEVFNEDKIIDLDVDTSNPNMTFRSRKEVRK